MVSWGRWVRDALVGTAAKTTVGAAGIEACWWALVAGTAAKGLLVSDVVHVHVMLSLRWTPSTLCQLSPLEESRRTMNELLLTCKSRHWPGFAYRGAQPVAGTTFREAFREAQQPAEYGLKGPTVQKALFRFRGLSFIL